jgi:hypothetical protein
MPAEQLSEVFLGNTFARGKGLSLQLKADG